MQYIEASCESGVNVDEAFLTLIRFVHLLDNSLSWFWTSASFYFFSSPPDLPHQQHSKLCQAHRQLGRRGRSLHKSGGGGQAQAPAGAQQLCKDHRDLRHHITDDHNGRRKRDVQNQEAQQVHLLHLQLRFPTPSLILSFPMFACLLSSLLSISIIIQ